jgi:hypothetical protein
MVSDFPRTELAPLSQLQIIAEWGASIVEECSEFLLVPHGLASLASLRKSPNAKVVPKTMNHPCIVGNRLLYLDACKASSCRKCQQT